MRIIIVGGTGTIGTAISKELAARHTLVLAGSKSGDVQVDINDLHSMEKMYQTVKDFDAVICAVGGVHFGPLAELTTEQINLGLNSKLMGQVNLVLAGMKYINQPGSFTLTSGILSRDPIRFGACAAMVNGALDAFVKAAAIEMPGQMRINIVSPTVLTESMDKLGSYFRGYESVPAERVALAYSKSVEGAQTGCVYVVG